MLDAAISTDYCRPTFWSFMDQVTGKRLLVIPCAPACVMEVSLSAKRSVSKCEQEGEYVI
jgi:hypothetical protein